MVIEHDPSRQPTAAAALSDAAGRLAPLYPLERFVAVNPFMGFSDRDFLEVAELYQSAANASLFAPRETYLEYMKSRRISEADVAWALERHRDLPGAPSTVEGLLAVAQEETETPPPPTLAHFSGWNDVRTELLSRWAAAYFDLGQARWVSPFKGLSPFQAWREEACIDRSPELMGLTGFRRHVDNTPTDAMAAAERALEAIGIPAESTERYLHALAASLAGWTGYARFLSWEAELRGEHDPAALELLAILLVWEHALLESPKASTDGWQPPRSGEAPVTEMILQSAFEHAWLEQVRGALRSAPRSEAQAVRPSAQVAFCIDVRSEVYRRALETSDPRLETVGFAGFFGFPIEVVELGAKHGAPHCPALLAPAYTIAEIPADGASFETAAEAQARSRSLSRAWKALKMNAVASFAFVEALGFPYLGRLLANSFGWSNPVHDHKEHRPLQSQPGVQLGRPSGIRAPERTDLAQNALTAMGLSGRPMGRLVVLAGHGANVVNNPHASGLDCGACGGHSGEHNARIAAAVLNDPMVRAGLASRGVDVPEDTVFVAALHDTTTDDVTILSDVPVTHQQDLARLKEAFASAGALSRAERAPRLGIEGGDIHRQIRERARDWSQVRPEWGLAGCAAFIVAPRERTRCAHLDGRSFLHDYDWKRDDGFTVLEAIMTAPMVVTSWINLQYYASTVDNRHFGSGNKTLHNVVSGLGVLEGNGGDLRVGLPMQSVSNGRELVHEPLRLSVFIEAPEEAMSRIIERHAGVRDLLENGWIHLFAIDEEGEVRGRYGRGNRWEPMS